MPRQLLWCSWWPFPCVWEFAAASGLNEFSGIIGGVVGGKQGGADQRKPFSVSGPAAGPHGDCVSAAAVLKSPAPEAFFLAVVLAGVFQLIMGISKLGVIGDYVPDSVIENAHAVGIISH
ncbi:MAG: SulP family inorganic anion transporter [Ferruginibacter sp.]